MKFAHHRTSVRRTAAALALLFAIASAPVTSPAEGGGESPGKNETRKWVFTKDGAKEVVVTPAQAAKRAERKKSRAAKRAAAKAKQGAAAAGEKAKDGAGNAEGKLNGAAGAP